METTNPAGRLHAILTIAKEFANPVQTVSASSLWADVFSIKKAPGFEIEVVLRLLQFRNLIEETEESLRNVEGITEKYFRPFDRIRGIPSQSLGALNSDVRGAILAVNDGDMTVLEFCSERLESQHSEPVISEDELEAVLEDVNALFGEVRKMDTLEEGLQSFILDGLESIRRAIYEFRIRGPKRLKEAISEILASYVMNHDIVKSAEEEASLQEFNKAFSRFAALISFASNSMSLLTAFTGPLLPGAPK